MNPQMEQITPAVYLYEFVKMNNYVLMVTQYMSNIVPVSLFQFIPQVNLQRTALQSQIQD